MKIIALTDIEKLSGLEPRSLYDLAKEINFKVVIWGNQHLPTNLNKNTLYCKLDDLDLIERVWANEDHIDMLN